VSVWNCFRNFGGMSSGDGVMEVLRETSVINLNIGTDDSSRRRDFMHLPRKLYVIYII
jgi:hypothetical protein